MVTASPWGSSPVFVLRGSLPAPSTLTTMSRSVSTPLSLLSVPQMGSAPTPSVVSFWAPARTLSSAPTHIASGVMMSRAVATVVHHHLALSSASGSGTTSGCPSGSGTNSDRSQGGPAGVPGRVPGVAAGPRSRPSPGPTAARPRLSPTRRTCRPRRGRRAAGSGRRRGPAARAGPRPLPRERAAGPIVGHGALAPDRPRVRRQPRSRAGRGGGELRGRLRRSRPPAARARA